MTYKKVLCKVLKRSFHLEYCWLIQRTSVDGVDNPRNNAKPLTVKSKQKKVEKNIYQVHEKKTDKMAVQNVNYCFCMTLENDESIRHVKKEKE